MKLAQKYFSVFAGGIVFIIYLFTLAPSVVQIDSGELAAVQITLGIAHPTGYPLYTILGFLFSLLPLPFTKIYIMNLLAAIYCSAAAGVFIQTVKLILDNLDKFNSHKALENKKAGKRSKKNKIAVIEKNLEKFTFTKNFKIYISCFTGFILAFSKTFWFQSTSVEVYSLHLLLICLILYALISAFIQNENEKSIWKDKWAALSIFLALSFSNHMTTLLILPAAAYLFFSKFGFNKAAAKKLLLLSTIFLAVLIIVYSYLPIRASQQPILNWGNPIDLERILRHVSGKQYQVWLFSSMAAAKKQLAYFFSNLAEEFNIALIPIAAGLFFSRSFSKKLFIFLIVMLVSTVFYSINYDIVDIDSYFLLAFISLALFASFGIIKLLSLIKINQHTGLLRVGAVFCFVILFAAFNFNKTDQSKTQVFEQYSKSLINSVPEKSIILSYQWDFFISASYYFQNVENFRKDVVIIDKELLRRSWYYNQLKRNHPDIFEGLKNEVKLFLDALAPFESDENYNPQLLENLYRQIITKLITTNFGKYNFYLGPELVEIEMQKGELSLPKDYYLVPHLFLFKIVRTKDYVAANNPDYTIEIPQRRSYYTNFIEEKIGSMLTRRAIYEMQFNKLEKAKLYVNKILKDFKGYKISPDLLRLVQ